MSISPISTSPYVQLGKSGLFIYQVGLGTMQFGWSADVKLSHEIMDLYIERGGNFIDTADCYSAWAGSKGGPENPGGVSEEIIGEWMNLRGNRENLVLATKVRAPMGVDFSDHRGTFRQREGLSRRWIIQACEDSLRRLQTDYIDLYQAHFIDPLVPIEETLSTFNSLIQQGKVRYIGCSNFSAWRLMQALWVSDVQELEQFVSLQPEYSLISPVRENFEMELSSLCQYYEIGVIPYSPLAGGMLTGKYQRDLQLPNSVRAEENFQNRVNEKNWQIINKLNELSKRTSLTPAQLAVNWLRAKPWVSSPIVGANNTQQLSEVFDGLSHDLAADIVAELDQVSDFKRSRTSLEE